MRQANSAAVALIKQFEGFRDRAYRDSVGVWTIGYGHTKTAHPGMTITAERGDVLLAADLRDAESAIERLVTVDLGDNEFGALVSFVFNLGAANLAKSTLLKKLNAGDRAGAAREFLRWDKAGGKTLPGLSARRHAEMELFIRG